MKANSNNPTGWDTRKSLNLLKSLIHPHSCLPQVDEDGDEEMEIDEDAVEKLCIEVGLPPSNTEDCNTVDEGYTQKQIPEDADVDMEEATSELVEKHEIMIADCAESVRNTQGCSNISVDIRNDLVEVKDEELASVDTVHIESSCEPSEERNLNPSVGELLTEESPSKMVEIHASYALSDSHTGVLVAGEASDSPDDAVNYASPSSLSIVPCKESPILRSPTPSVSPRINSSRKSLRTSSMLTASQTGSKDE